MGIYNVFNRTADWTECEVSGALPAGFLNLCAAEGVALLAAESVDACTLRVHLTEKGLKKAKRLAVKSQCTLRVISSGGALKAGRKLRRRVLPVVCLLAITCLLVWSKLFIWEISVTGNETVSAPEILDALRECGVTYGSFWPGITSDNLRSELLTELPSLAWATVNIYGSRAEVIVRERVPKPVIYNAKEQIDIVAEKTGFVTNVQALCGTAQVKPGSAAATGEVLIAGAADSPFGGTRLLHAVGTVTADTYYELSASAPCNVQMKSYTGKKFVRWAIQIGKNRYNFYRNSSICTDGCDKITSVWNFKIEGLFSLPISLIRETDTEYTLSEQGQDENLICRTLEQTLRERLFQEIGADGEVQSEYYSHSEADGLINVCLRACCSENIGTESIIQERDEA